MTKQLRTIAITALLALTGSSAMAVPIFGGSDLLGAGDAALLEQWRGEGSMTLANIFDKEAGDTAADFHAAVDNQGETFSLIEVLGNAHGTFDQSIVIGGYNPVSWDGSLHNYVYNYSGPRDAFIFNLNDDVVMRQNAGHRGRYQTYNRISYGPTFGGGHDIYVANNLSYGYTNGWSYGNTTLPYSTYSATANILGEWGSYLSFGQIEVFAVNASLDTADQVPEPGTALLVGLGFAAFSLARRRART